jgi:hypothetical protein
MQKVFLKNSSRFFTFSNLKNQKGVLRISDCKFLYKYNTFNFCKKEETMPSLGTTFKYALMIIILADSFRELKE